MKANINKIAKYIGWLFLAGVVVALSIDFLRRGIFEEQVGINLLVVGDENAGLMIIRPRENLISWVSLPTDLKIKIYNSTATYPINSLWKFGQAEKNPYEITEMSIGMSMGVVIPRLVKVDRVASVDSLLGEFLSLGAITDLSWKDRWAIYKYVSDAAVSKRIFELEIPKSATDEVPEADGKEFLMFNQIISLWTKDKFYHESILEENTDVSINNISEIPGMGLNLSKQLEAAGMRVVEVVNNREDMINSKGCHFLSSKNHKATNTYLRNQVGCVTLPTSENKETSEGLIKIWIR